MACRTCMSSGSMFINNTPQPNTQVCTKTLQYYQDMLVKVQTQLQGNPNFLIYQQTIKSQILQYDRSCKLFESFIVDTIDPLVV